MRNHDSTDLTLIYRLLIFSLLTPFLIIPIGFASLFAQQDSPKNDSVGACMIEMTRVVYAANPEKADFAVGRSDQVTQLMRAWAQGKSTLASGDVAVGKTATHNTAFLQINDLQSSGGRLPAGLKNAKFIKVNWQDLVATEQFTRLGGAETPGSTAKTAEEAFVKALDQQIANAGKSRVIVHVDEWERLLAEAPSIAAQIKQRMIEGKIILSAETRNLELARQDQSFRHFKVVEFKNYTDEQVRDIVFQEAIRIQEREDVVVSDGAIQAAIKLADKYFTDQPTHVKAAEILRDMAVEAQFNQDGFSTSIAAKSLELQLKKEQLKQFQEADTVAPRVIESLQMDVLRLEADLNGRMAQLGNAKEALSNINSLNSKMLELSQQKEKEVERGNLQEAARLQQEIARLEEQAATAMKEIQGAYNIALAAGQVRPILDEHLAIEIVSQQISERAEYKHSESLKDAFSRKYQTLKGSIEVVESKQVAEEDLIGHPEVKRYVRQVLRKLANEIDSRAVGADGANRLLVVGPPGTGKSMLIDWISSMMGGATRVRLNMANLMSKWQGESEQRAKQFFDEIERRLKNGEAIIIEMEEVDSIGKTRGADGGNGTKSDVLNIILTRVQELSQYRNVFIVANTNRLDMLDSAFTRPGRFDQKILMTIPKTPQERADLLTLGLRKMQQHAPEDMKDIIDDLALKTDGYSQADLTEGFSKQVRESVFVVRDAIRAELEGKTDFVSVIENAIRNPETQQDFNPEALRMIKTVREKLREEGLLGRRLTQEEINRIVDSIKVDREFIEGVFDRVSGQYPSVGQAEIDRIERSMDLAMQRMERELNAEPGSREASGSE